MALRRLFSGWLIAMAALARSVAQALERASEDRSSEAVGAPSDPVMAALAERYPGAPAHWLAHVAERTSQLAETGQAPLSLNSDPTTWPTLRPDATPARETPEDRPVAASPGRSAPPPREPEIPSLAALRDRPSEVWRRPEPEPRRRARPVFAPVASERPSRPAATEAADPPRRPRSPLTFSAQAEEGDRGAARLATPRSDVAATEARPRQGWPEAASRRETSLEPTPRPDLEQTPKQASLDTIFAPTDLKRAEPTSLDAGSQPVAVTPPVRRQVSWFFAKTAPSRLGRALDLSAYPRREAGTARMTAEKAVVTDPAPHEAYVYGTSRHRTGSPDRSWLALTRPTARLSIFQALAAIGVRPRQALELGRTPEPAVDRSSLERDPPGSTASPVLSRPRHSPTVAGVAVAPEDIAPARAGEAVSSRVAEREEREERRAENGWTPADDRQARDRRPSFAALRSTKSRPNPTRFVDAPSDDRWPELPPPTFTPPVGVEASAPRWDQLAREQEEGRWSV